MSVKTTLKDFSNAQLAEAKQETRNYTLSIFNVFQSAGLDKLSQVPYLAIINPPLWELGHIVWFSEWLILRGAPCGKEAMAQHPCILAAGDRWFDSTPITHKSRWTLDLPDTNEVKKYASTVLARILEKLAKLPNDATALYPYRMALAHENMHLEAFSYTLQTLGLSVPAHLVGYTELIKPALELHLESGSFMMGSPETDAFVFDNEKWAQPLTLPSFRINATRVSNAQYQKFVQDGGYVKQQFWDEAGRAWLASTQRRAPRYWVEQGGVWRCERFGKSIALENNESVRHVSLHEAQAYCAWSGQRLPSEAEWEYAASSGDAAFYWGDLWEWTSTPFKPYVGFSADIYREYSAPWFDTHQVLRGASFATQACIRSARYRNFFTPERDDIFSGFRTCVS